MHMLSGKEYYSPVQKNAHICERNQDNVRMGWKRAKLKFKNIKICKVTLHPFRASCYTLTTHTHDLIWVRTRHIGMLPLCMWVCKENKGKQAHRHIHQLSFLFSIIFSCITISTSTPVTIVLGHGKMAINSAVVVSNTILTSLPLIFANIHFFFVNITTLTKSQRESAYNHTRKSLKSNQRLLRSSPR